MLRSKVPPSTFILQPGDLRFPFSVLLYKQSPMNMDLLSNSIVAGESKVNGILADHAKDTSKACLKLFTTCTKTPAEGDPFPVELSAYFKFFIIQSAGPQLNLLVSSEVPKRELYD